jgi:uncharacterized peroxidase-related enzyme
MSYSYIEGSSREELSEFEDYFEISKSFMGYVPNSNLLMAENPELFKSFSSLASTIFMSKNIEESLIQLIALASSLSSGCKYCQSHTSHGANKAGVDPAKILEILNYQNSDLYSKEEKAVLNLSFAAGENPNSANKEHFNRLKKYFSKKAVIDIVAVISLFGFLNRWNDTLGTEIEEVPNSFMQNNSIIFE